MRALLLAALWVQALRAHCPRLCDCKWKGGKESVLCPSANLTRLPAHLDAGTQLLDLNDNPLATIAKDAFASAGLLNLQKIYVAKCRLKTIDRFAFRKLINLVELDLSYNFLSAVPSYIFDSVPELRELKLSGNPIQRLLNDAFMHVPQLVRLELSDCRLGTVEPKAFSGLENSLEWLKLDRNRLSDVKSTTITSLQSLHGLELATNPWNCTCSLRPLREWMLKHNVPYGTPPACRFPPRLAGKSWDRMELDEFACAPEIIPNETESKAEEGDNVTLSCRVGGEPLPRVLWLLRNRVLVNATSITGKRAYLVKAKGGAASLTVLGAEPQDAGLYTCAAENLAGRAEAVVKLAVAKRVGNSTNGNLALAAGATAALLVLAVCLLFLGIKAARNKPRAHPPPCSRHRCDSYEKIEMNHKFNNHVPLSNNLIENDNFAHRNEPLNPIGAIKKRGDYRHVPSQDTEDEAETYDEDMETPTPTPTTETLANPNWRSVPPTNWSLHRDQRNELKTDETDLHIPRLSEYRDPRIELTPDSNSSSSQPYNVFISSDLQNKVNNNQTDPSLAQSQNLRRQLVSPNSTIIYTSPTPSSSIAVSNVDDQNNVTNDPDKNYPDLLEINSYNINTSIINKRSKSPNSAANNKDFPFFTLPRKEQMKNNNNNSRNHNESDSQSPLLPGSRYGSSGGESSIGGNSNRRLSIESYSHYNVPNNFNNKTGQRSNSFLNLATSANNRGAPSLPGSPASATPLLQLRGLPRAEIARAPFVTPTPSMPLTYDYHAAQLERFLEEYRSLQEQLCKMKETCETISSTRENKPSNSRFIDPLLFSNCVTTPSSSEDANPRSILKNRPTVSVTATSGGSGVSGNEASSSPLALSPNDLGGSISPWTSSSSILKRLGGTGDFFRS